MVTKLSAAGQSLIEVILGLAIGVIIITVLSYTTLTSLSASLSSKNINLGNQYAQEGLEIMRSMRSVLDGTYCLSTDSPPVLVNSSTTPSCLTTPNVDKFIRTVKVTSATTNCSTSRQVEVTVKWTDGKCPSGTLYCHQVPLISCLSTL